MLQACIILFALVAPTEHGEHFPRTSFITQNGSEVGHVEGDGHGPQVAQVPIHFKEVCTRWFARRPLAKTHIFIHQLWSNKNN